MLEEDILDGWMDGWMNGWMNGWMDGGGVRWRGRTLSVCANEL